jgi:hypothetical protein
LLEVFFGHNLYFQRINIYGRKYIGTGLTTFLKDNLKLNGSSLFSSSKQEKKEIIDFNLIGRVVIFFGGSIFWILLINYIYMATITIIIIDRELFYK